ncbi:MAG TPA: cell division FtsA domain-containing protein [Candidatus Saccharimonadia bacterium]|jgi:cell division protein FtsA|nr:cell division FtsA domain-containing protein [Candidatus Saccharimonadia bacterium]
MALRLLEKFVKLRGSAPGPRYLVALDIGTEFVKALIGEVILDPASGAPAHVEIIGVGRQRQRLTDMSSGAVTDITGVVENCDSALKMAEKMSGVVAKDVVIGIAGELVKGASTIIRYKRAAPSDPIDMTELRKILDRVQYRAFERAREQLTWETGYKELEVKLVNTAIVDVQIDGYRVTNPIGFQGKDVSIQLFNAFAPMVHLGALQTVAQDLDLNLVNIAAEPFAVAKSVGGQDSGEFSAIFIDIGGGTTDIALVNNGGVEGTKMFAIGGRAFTKRIAQVANVSFEKAEEMKIAYGAGKLSAKGVKVVEEAVNADIQVWLSGVELSLAEFDRVDHLPAKILLCGGGTGLPQIVEALKGKEWYKNLPFARKPVVNHISPSEVTRVVDKTGKLTSFADITPMGLANLGLDQVGGETTTDTLMRKLARAISA